MAPSRRPYFGLGLNLPLARSTELVQRLRMADTAGYDLFSIMDHPYAGDRHEAYAALGFALGHTRRIPGYVGVTNLPLRPAPVLARTLSTLSALSDRRVVLGLGSGGFWDRIAGFGADRRSPVDAVAAFEEAILLVKALSGGGAGPMSFDGRFYRVSDADPAPGAAPPIWTGATGPRALGITGRLADGWIPPFGSDWRSARYRCSRPLIDAAAAAAGRDPGEVISFFNVGGMLTDRDLPETRDPDERWVGGSARQWAAELTGAVLEHGAGGFNTSVTSPDGDLDLDTARRFAAEVIPAVRRAVDNASTA